MLLQFAGALQHDPMIFALEFAFFASEAPDPVRLPSVFIPTRRMDKPIPSAPVVLNIVEIGTVPLPNAVLMPNPWMVW